MSISRRGFLESSALAGLGPGFCLGKNDPLSTAATPEVAVIMTAMTYRSHAHVIMENFVQPYMFNGQKTEPGVNVVAMYVDQFPAGDMARGIARKYGIPIYDTIQKACSLGGAELKVDAVLSIGEHGDYPFDELGRHQYPRKRFFDEILKCVKKSGRGIPIFNDKHLSFRWDWSKEMFDQSMENVCPLMAGSSVPLAQRIPNLELSPGCEIVEAISIHGGGVESYDFHGLEVLQSMIESRKGGETGVARLQFLDSNAVLEKMEKGEISREIFDKAMRAVDSEANLSFEEIIKTSHGIHLEYKDGLMATCLSIKQIKGNNWAFGCSLKDDSAIKACRFYVGPWNNRNLFKALSHSIQTHFKNRSSPYSIERTLLTTGMVNFAMDSKFAGGKILPTPQLEIAYLPKEFRSMREMGSTWKILTEETPQPKGFFQQYR